MNCSFSPYSIPAYVECSRIICRSIISTIVFLCSHPAHCFEGLIEIGDYGLIGVEHAGGDVDFGALLVGVLTIKLKAE